jgi:hypothetical protein
MGVVRRRTSTLAGCLALLALGTVVATPARAATPTSAGEVIADLHHDVSAPLRSLAADSVASPRSFPAKAVRASGGAGNQVAAGVPTSQLAPAAVATAAPAQLTNFDGIGNGFQGFTVSSAPADPIGAVGPNHYVQVVNADMAVFNKSTGAAMFGPVATNTLWSGFGGGCQTNNDGDASVQYDPIADRWLISQFSVSTTPFLQCVAISTTPDPMGAYARYSFAYDGFNDYPKFGVWPDGYYVTFNMFNAAGTAFLGTKVCAYDRAKMLVGAPATQQCFDTSTAFGGLLPADLDGSRLPPAGAPEQVLGLGPTGSTLAAWQFHVDWATPSNSTFTGPATLSVASYQPACGASGTCIPQLGTTQQLDSLSDRLMNRLAYRNFADGHQSLVVSHSVTAGTGVGERWYELRLDAANNPSVFQQGTYAPDSNFRWMGSIAQDQAGDMALGYSLSSASINPKIAFTGRLAGDALGQMTQGEGTIISGGGSQLTNLSRWGDYSQMDIDPVDDCTFWYTNQYIPSNGTFNWKTRIASFKLPGCGVVANDFSIGASPNAVSVVSGSAATSTISTAVVSGVAEAVDLSASGVPAGATASFSPPSVSAGGSATVTLDSGTAAPGTYTVTVNGTAASATHSTTITFTVTAPPPPDEFSVSVSPASATVAAGSSTSFTVSTAIVSGNAQTISLSVTGLPAGVTGSFSPTSVTAGGSATLTLSAATSAPAATSTFTITGTAGSGSHTATANLTVTTAGPSVTVLANAVPISGISGALASQQYFRIDVPTGQDSLTVSISGGNADADLYVRRGALPTTSAFDCRPFTTGNNETCTFNAPAAGAWYVMVRGYTAFSGVTLTATYATTPALTNGVPVTGLAGATGSQRFFKLDVPSGRTTLTFVISGGTGDADLYVRLGSKPTTGAFTCRPFLIGNNETCTFNAPAAGTWYVMLRGYTAFSGVTLKGTYV